MFEDNCQRVTAEKNTAYMIAPKMSHLKRSEELSREEKELSYIREGLSILQNFWMVS